MTKRLNREFGRFDLDLLDSEEFLSMQPAIRNHAYLYLLALTGWSRKRRTDGIVALEVARDLARRMGRDPTKLLRCLEEVAMISLQSGNVYITKYTKWQETRAEIEARQEASRIRQATHRAPHVTRDTSLTSRVSHTTEIEIEVERETEVEGSKEPLVVPLQPNGLKKYGIQETHLHVSGPAHVSKILEGLVMQPDRRKEAI